MRPLEQAAPRPHLQRAPPGPPARPPPPAARGREEAAAANPGQRRAQGGPGRAGMPRESPRPSPPRPRRAAPFPPPHPLPGPAVTPGKEQGRSRPRRQRLAAPPLPGPTAAPAGGGRAPRRRSGPAGRGPARGTASPSHWLSASRWAPCPPSCLSSHSALAAKEASADRTEPASGGREADGRAADGAASARAGRGLSPYPLLSAGRGQRGRCRCPSRASRSHMSRRKPK